MRVSKFVAAVLLFVLLVTPGATAIEKQKDYDFNLSSGSQRVIAVDEDWEGDIVIELDADPEVDLYIIEGSIYNSSAIKVRVFENVTDVRTIWSEEGNFSIVIDNLDNPSDHDAPGLETAKIELTIRWSEDIPADPFLTAFCCGGVLVFVIILFYIFVRFFLRKPPRPEVQEVRPGTVRRMPKARGARPPAGDRTEPPAPTMRPRKPPGPKWPPDGGEGPGQDP